MRVTCPFRTLACSFINRLERNGLKGSSVYRMLANELDRDLLTARSRLHLALPKAAPLMDALKAAGRSRPLRRAAIAAIRAAKTRVR